MDVHPGFLERDSSCRNNKLPSKPRTDNLHSNDNWTLVLRSFRPQFFHDGSFLQEKTDLGMPITDWRPRGSPQQPDRAIDCR